MLRRSRTLLIWLLALALSVASGILAFGVIRDRSFADDHPPQGKLLPAGPWVVHAIDQPIGEGRAVVFIHGNPGTAADFSLVQAKLSPRVRTIAVDRPGYGWTQRPREAMSPLDQARMLHDAVKTLGVKEPVLVGFSFGGPVATAWALEYPEEVGALVYLAAVADPVEGHPMRGAQADLVKPLYGKLLAFGLGPLLAPGSVERGYVDAFFPKPLDAALVERGKLQFSRPTSLLASAWDWKMLEGELPKLAARYRELELPVEAVGANQDRIVGPSHLEYLQRHVPGIHVHLVEAAGHQLITTHPDEVVAAVMRALARVK